LRSQPFSRAQAVERLRGEIWRYLSEASAHAEDVAFDAERLLQMRSGDVRRLAAVHFVLSHEVERLLEAMPQLIRQLANTTARDEEWSAERIRGPISWPTTLSARAATGLPTLYVTHPARRAFQTPENEILLAALTAIARAARETRWAASHAPDAGRTIRERAESTDRWARTRMLSELDHRPVTGESLRRVRTGRHRRRYAPAVDVVQLHRHLLRRLDRARIRDLIESHGLASRKDEVLLELECAFTIEAGLRDEGWALSYPRLVQGGAFVRAKRGASRVDVHYQSTPPELATGSRYADVQRAHELNVGSLRPDFVIRYERLGDVRWLLVEVKGVERRVDESARAAARDLLMYRRAFHAVLDHQPTMYGLGVAWGAEVQPSLGSEIALASPDTLSEALTLVIDEFERS
jgi:hypothetical protein